ncbi:protein of unknown function [Methanoculleus bourgensis]|uniref:Uncharacterized protein n=1 Tax=Methanoculleus bourgensis TaxID=83986 RepID=A0A0X3BK97_9EURY|nr:protein of unknown function [Methanoculleus bourgensis]
MAHLLFRGKTEWHFKAIYLREIEQEL